MIFDLKGSLKGRYSKFNEKWWMTEKGHDKCMKDRNLLQINQDLKLTSALNLDN